MAGKDHMRVSMTEEEFSKQASKLLANYDELVATLTKLSKDCALIFEKSGFAFLGKVVESTDASIKVFQERSQTLEDAVKETRALLRDFEDANNHKFVG